MGHEQVREQLKREITPELYAEIRALWKRHSIAEDARDLPGLISTLTDDCVYELPQIGESWRGHEGATRFYTELLGAFPDIHFDLQEIVIGPQGVFEVAQASGTWREAWLGRRASGAPVEFGVMIFFPWDPERRLFRGERVWVDDPAVLARGG